MQELSRYGQIVYPIKKIPLGCKSPLVKHLVSFRRQVFMILKNGEDELDLVLKFKAEGFDYAVFVSSDITIKCFTCSKIGHLSRNCPDKLNLNTEQIDVDEAGSAVGESSAAANPDNTPLEPLEEVKEVNSAETCASCSTVDDGVVAAESAVPENAVGLSTLSSVDIVKGNPRLNDCGLDMEVESTFQTPIKRRSRNDKVSKQVKIGDAVEDEIIVSDNDDSDPSVSVFRVLCLFSK